MVKDHSAKGLAQGILSCARDFSVEDNKVQGIDISRGSNSLACGART